VSSVSGQIGTLPESQSVRNFDWSMNLIIFGVDDNRDPNIWHTTVNDVFNGLAGHSVDTVDMFRLGRFCDTEKGLFWWSCDVFGIVVSYLLRWEN